MAYNFDLEEICESSVYAEVPTAYVELLDTHLTTALGQLQSEQLSHPAIEEISICLKILEILKENFQVQVLQG